MEKGAAGDEHLEGRTGFQSFSKYRGRREDLLEVVEQKQEWSGVLQPIADQLCDGTIRDFLNAEGIGHGGRHQVGCRIDARLKIERRQ